MKTMAWAALAAIAIAIPAAAGNVVIDFSQPPLSQTGSTISYADAVFSADQISFSSNNICAVSKSGCTFAPVTVSFTVPVNDLTFTVNWAAIAWLNVDIFTTSGPFNLFVPTTSAFPSLLIDLTSYQDVTGLVMLATNPAYYDDFSFTTPGGGAVPEPASWAMLIAGMGLIGAVLRRRRLAAAA